MPRWATQQALRCLVTKTKGKHDQPRESQCPEQANKPAVPERLIFLYRLQSLRGVSPRDLRKGEEGKSNTACKNHRPQHLFQLLTDQPLLQVKGTIQKRRFSRSGQVTWLLRADYLISKMVCLSDQAVVRVQQENVWELTCLTHKECSTKINSLLLQERKFLQGRALGPNWAWGIYPKDQHGHWHIVSTQYIYWLSWWMNFLRQVLENTSLTRYFQRERQTGGKIKIWSK